MMGSRTPPRDPWAEFDDAPAAGGSDVWGEFQDAPAPALPAPGASVRPTGQAYDGDTFRLSTGQNGRLLGADAFELNQTGRTRTGATIPLGIQSRDLLRANLDANSSFAPAGSLSYGRPVGTLSAGGRDYGRTMLDQGMGMAAPEYLRGDPARLNAYMEAERIARLNRRGAWSSEVQSPTSFRRGNPDPWAAPEEAQDGKGAAYFADEPTPTQGLRPDIERGYIGLAQDRTSTADDLMKYASDNGFTISRSEAEQFVRDRNAGARVSDQASYRNPPRVLTDLGDGTTGAAVRGLGDPVNFLDEMGAVVDSLGGTEGRENVWDSDRRFGDILYNNLDQNRSILEFDEDRHPYARFGGQLASGVLLPGASTEGVGFAAARSALRAGASRFAAQTAARNAFRNRLMTAGGIEGLVAGAGAGEGGPIDRLPSTLAGGAIGTGGGLLLGAGLPYAASATRQARNYFRDRLVGAVSNEAQQIGTSPDVVGSAPRVIDRLDLSDRIAGMAEETPIPSRSAPVDDWDEFADVEPEVGPHGPIHSHLATNYRAALDRLMTDQDGEVPGALSHPEIGAIDLIWGNRNAGLAHIAAKHPEVLDDLPEIIAGMQVKRTQPHARRIQLESADHMASVALDWHGESKRWLLTAYRKEGDAPAPPGNGRGGAGGQDDSPGLGAGTDISQGTPGINGEPLSPDAGRQRDTIDVWSEFADAQMQPVAEPNLVPNARLRQMSQPATREEMARLARDVQPGDVTPLPSNAVESVEEAAGIGAGMRPTVPAPNERDALPPYPVNGRNRRNPMDLLSWLRTQGGLREQGGELSHLEVTNAPRRGMEFAGDEGFLGNLVRPDGMTLDEAADHTWRAGWFPDMPERPTVAEFLDALDATNRGGSGRVFHPDDFDAIDAYRTARNARFDVERAADEGAPMVEDRGQPVGLDDLDANTPPATAYEDLPSVGGYAGNIRLDGLNSAEDIRRALTGTDARAGGFEAARRGRISHAETEALASELGMTADDLLRRRRGQALNAEQALAARQILARSADELVKLARRAQGGGDQALEAFRSAWLRHAAIQEQVSGMTAEAGRALQQFRQAADAVNASRVHEVARRTLVDANGGRDALEDAAKAIIDLHEQGATPGAVNSFALKAARPRFRDKLIELYYNSLLSGPQTHAVNVLSNALTAGLQLPEQATGAALGLGRRAIMRGRANTDRVLLSEIGPRLVGLMQGTKEGLRQFARTARTGHVPDHVTKVEAQTQEAISGFKGKIIRTPTRLLAAEDELFKAIARRMEINGLAVRKATAEGLRGDALRRRIEELSTNPTDEMFDEALDYARYLTFQRPLGKVGNLATAMTQEWPALKLIVPFIRTPTNILKFAAERSPLAPVLKEVRQDIASGGARRDMAVARIALGTGLGVLMTQWASEGRITGGGPADDNARSLMLADGWQPYSVRVGDRWVSYQRFDPLATTVGVAADLVETGEYMTDSQREKAAALVTAAIIKNLSNKVWLSGITDLSQAIDDPERYGTGFISRMAGSVAVPAIVAQGAKAIDPVAREASGPIDRIQSRIPFASRSLLPRRNIWGQEIRNQGGGGPDMISPFRMSTARNDPITRELLGIGAGIGKPSRMIGGLRLDDATYNAYQALAGQNLRSDLESFIPSPWWVGATNEDRQDAVEKAKRDARKAARNSGMLGSRGR